MDTMKRQKHISTQYESPHPSWKVSTMPVEGFPGGSEGKAPACNVGDPGSIPGSGSSPGEGNGNPFQYSGLENSMDCIVHGVAKSRTQLSAFHLLKDQTLCFESVK